MWTLVLLVIVFALLDAIHPGLAVAVGIVLAVVLLSRAFARTARRELARYRR